MKKTFFVLLIVCNILLLRMNVYADNYVVKLKTNHVPSSLMEILTELNEDHRLYTSEKLEDLSGYAEFIEYIEENSEIHINDSIEEIGFSTDVMLMSAKDTYYSQQWQIGNIKANYAWDVLTYGNEVNVAVIDSGCYAHKDLGDVIKAGYNTMSGGNSSDYEDTLGHGTIVAGTIAAQHNMIGTRGISPKVNLYPIKVTVTGQNIRLADVAAAIYKAIDDYNCKVINLSLGGYADNTFLREAVNYAYRKNTIVVAAAGNYGNTSNGTKPLYPAGYDGAISVACVDKNNKRWEKSQRVSSVEISAPGYNCYGPYINEKYATSTGTSLAAPMVSAAAAIMLSAKPDMTVEEFRSYLKTYAIPLKDDYTGAGLLNIEAMLKALIDNEEFYISPRNDTSVYVQNNSSQILYTGFYTDYSGVKFMRIGGKSEIILDYVTKGGKMFLWSQNLRPLKKPQEY